MIWYLARSRGGWQWVAWALFVLHFAIPFFLLLMRSVKRDPPALAMMAGLILFMQLVFDVLPGHAGLPGGQPHGRALDGLLDALWASAGSGWRISSGS